MIKDCKTCIHQRVCQHKELNPKFKEEMRGLIKKWGNIYSEDCPEWHQKMITVDNIYDNDPWSNKIDDDIEERRKTDCRTWNEQERIQPWVKRLSKGELPPKITYELNHSVDKTINSTCKATNSIKDENKGRQIYTYKTDCESPKNWTKEKERLSEKYRTTVKPDNIEILSTALEEFSKHRIISADTMEDLLNTCDRELIALLADESTFVERANELLKKKKTLQDDKDIYGGVTTQQALDAIGEYKRKVRNILNKDIK